MNNEEIAKIYEEYSEKIFYYIYAKVSNQYVAEDLTSQVFLKLVEKASSYDESKASISTWIYTVARNTVIDYYRTNKIVSELDENIEDSSGVDDVVLAKESLEELANALGQLEERERKLIILYYYDGLSLKEIAQKLDLSYSMIKILHKRALDKLKNYL